MAFATPCVEDNDGNIIVGGSFTEAGGVPALNVAKWDGNSWSAMGSGLNGTCRALAVTPDGTVYAGGDFPRKIKYFNGTAWYGVHQGMNGTCYALAVNEDGVLFAGGDFTFALDTLYVVNGDYYYTQIRYIRHVAWLEPGFGLQPLFTVDPLPPGASLGLGSRPRFSPRWHLPSLGF